MRHAIVDASLIGRFATLPGSYTRIAVGGAPGWHRFEDAYDAAETFVPDGETRATDALVMYFTSGTTAKPKLVLHSHQSYPVGLLSAMYCFARQPGDIQLGIASPDGQRICMAFLPVGTRGQQYSRWRSRASTQGKYLMFWRAAA
jgi:acetyl-CoA synthetase